MNGNILDLPMDCVDDEELANDDHHNFDCNIFNDYNNNGIETTTKKISPITKHKTKIFIGIVLTLWCSASLAFLSLAIRSSLREQNQALFDQQASNLIHSIESTWNEYEYAGLWVHLTTTSRSHNFTREEFRVLYENIQSGGLDFQAVGFVPSISHEMRDETENESRTYYSKNYPFIQYEGITGLEPTTTTSSTASTSTTTTTTSQQQEELSIQARSKQPFYFPVHYVEPIEPNTAAIDFDLYSPAESRTMIQLALATWEPSVLTGRGLAFLPHYQQQRKYTDNQSDAPAVVDHDDDDSNVILLMHPGVPSRSAPNARPQDLSLLEITVSSFLAQATKNQDGDLAVYLYDTTNKLYDRIQQPKFLGGVNIHRHHHGIPEHEEDNEERNKTGEAAVYSSVDEISMDTLIEETQLRTPIEIYADSVKIASNTWEVVVVPLGSTQVDTTFDPKIFIGMLLMLVALVASVWFYANMIIKSRIQEIEEKAQIGTDKNIQASLFPSKVQDYAIHHDGEPTKQIRTEIMDLSATLSVDSSDDDEIMCGVATTTTSSKEVFGATSNNRQIPTFFTDVTLMFAELVGFTAWSSTRDPSQVFTLLEVIYHSFDVIAEKRRVFKLETVGDCYVAACGIPDPQDNHAENMAVFATDCLNELHELLGSIEISMGSDVADIDVRIGLHSGSVTAGVLQGGKGSFRLFGDTMNMANQIESTGCKGKIHVSSETAEHLQGSGKGHWLNVRKDAIFAKGKGHLKTYWLDIHAEISSDKEVGTSVVSETAAGLDNIHKGAKNTPNIKSLPKQVCQEMVSKEDIDYFNKNELDIELIDKCYDILSHLLKGVVANQRLQQNKNKNMLSEPSNQNNNNLKTNTTIDGKCFQPSEMSFGNNLLEEVQDVISFPGFASHQVMAENEDHDSICETACCIICKDDIDHIQLDAKVETELREYIGVIAKLYHQTNPFHNFEHANHVLVSVSKLITRITQNYHNTIRSDPSGTTQEPKICTKEGSSRGIDENDENTTDPKAKNYEYVALYKECSSLGIALDPLVQFAMAFAALIHNVDHPGVSNSTLVSEVSEMAQNYHNQSIAEQNSIDLAWEILMGPGYQKFVYCLCGGDEGELRRFRQLVVNMVMATDMFDKNLVEQRELRWDNAFVKNHSNHDDEEGCRDDSKIQSTMILHRRMTVVLEYLIQASDVSYMMQHWQVYRKWNERLFHERYRAFKAGRLPEDPSQTWYVDEVEFFDDFIIPLAKNLDTCGVLGDTDGELQRYANANRKAWKKRGESLVASYVRSFHG